MLMIAKINFKPTASYIIQAKYIPFLEEGGMTSKHLIPYNKL